MLVEDLVGCKVTPGKCFLIEGPPDRRGEVTSQLQAAGCEVTLKWASDSSFGILAVKLESK